VNPRPRTQRGAALFVSLIMLVVITLFVLSAINMSTVNLRITANSQARSEGVAAAQQAIEQVISKDFTKDPQPASLPVSLRADQTKTDYTVEVAKPSCINAVPVTQAELAGRDNTDPDDVACRASASVQNAGITPAPEINAICRAQQWDVNGVVEDAARSAAKVSVHQGVARRVEGWKTC
jgi:Tfp pilus assembly protein PilX